MISAQRLGGRTTPDPDTQHLIPGTAPPRPNCEGPEPTTDRGEEWLRRIVTAGRGRKLSPCSDAKISFRLLRHALHPRNKAWPHPGKA